LGFLKNKRLKYLFYIEIPSVNRNQSFQKLGLYLSKFWKIKLDFGDEKEMWRWEKKSSNSSE
jgi:hypothetical protein